MNLLKSRKEAMFQFGGEFYEAGGGKELAASGANRRVEGVKKFG